MINPARVEAWLALSLAVSPCAAQTVTVDPGAGTGGVVAPSVTVAPGGGVGSGSLTMAPSLGVTGAGVVLSAPGVQRPSVSAAAAAPGAVSAGVAPARAAASVPVSGVAVPGVVSAATPAAPAASAAAAPAAAAQAASSPAAAAAAAPGAPGARAGANADGRAPGASAPTASSVLSGAAGRVSAAGAIEAAGGDELSVHAALGHVFDAVENAPRGPESAGVAGRTQTERQQMAQEISFANKETAANAPALYEAVIQKAEKILPPAAASSVEGLVRDYAAKKVQASFAAAAADKEKPSLFEDLAASAYRSAVSGDKNETERALSAFDKWDHLLGAPGRPGIPNVDELKSDVRRHLSGAAAGSSAPHVWFERRGDAYVAVLPTTSRVPKIPALAASFALAPSAEGAFSPLADAYRAYAAAPGASSGAGLVYRARHALGEGVPAAAIASAGFWLRSVLEAVWQRLVALFRGAPSYDLSRADGRSRLSRDAGLARAARGAAADAEALLSAERPTIGGARAAFAAAARAAAALDALGRPGAAAAVAELRSAFETAVSGSDASSPLPSGASEFIEGPGGLEHWVRRVGELARAADVRPGAGTDVVNLGAASGPALGAAALARELGAPAAFVALDDQLWARGRGRNGAVSLSADLRATSAGGSLELVVDSPSPDLARRLSDLGLAVNSDGGRLRAELGAEDFGRDADELPAVAARALAIAMGAESPGEDAASLRALIDAEHRDPDGAAALAARLDGRPAFAGARVIADVGDDYEVLAPVMTSRNGRPSWFVAMRDQATGLLAAAVEVRPALMPAR
jgi:hypothetical protein